MVNACLEKNTSNNNTEGSDVFTYHAKTSACLSGPPRLRTQGGVGPAAPSLSGRHWLGGRQAAEAWP